jgi:hypothetical protein
MVGSVALLATLLAIGYYLLIWFGVIQFNVFELELPGIERPPPVREQDPPLEHE